MGGIKNHCGQRQCACDWWFMNKIWRQICVKHRKTVTNTFNWANFHLKKWVNKSTMCTWWGIWDHLNWISAGGVPCWNYAIFCKIPVKPTRYLSISCDCLCHSNPFKMRGTPPSSYIRKKNCRNNQSIFGTTCKEHGFVHFFSWKQSVETVGLAGFPDVIRGKLAWIKWHGCQNSFIRF